jgi:hypothetical protein
MPRRNRGHSVERSYGSFDNDKQPRGSNRVISKEIYATLVRKYPAFGKRSDKVKDLIRDTLEPSDEIQYARSVKVGDIDGMVLMTQKDLYAFWMSKMLFFFNVATMQKFHFSQIRRVEQTGNVVFVRSEVDPSQPGGDYEENTFSFTKESGAKDFGDFLKMKSPAGA